MLTMVRYLNNFIYGMEPEKMIQEKLLEVTKGYALVMLKMVVRREKSFILLLMHRIHVETMIQ